MALHAMQAGGMDFAQEAKFDFWGVLNRRKWIVFLGLMTGIAIGIWYYYWTAPTYQSAAIIRIEPKDPNYMRLSRISDEAMMPNAAQILPTRHDKIINSELKPHFLEQRNQLVGFVVELVLEKRVVGVNQIVQDSP